MFKRISMLILGIIFIAVGAVIFCIYDINQENWNKYANDYVNSKVQGVNYFIENRIKNMENAIYAHAYWTDVLEYLKKGDKEWLYNNVGGYIVDAKLFNIDYILLANESLSFITENGGSNQEILEHPIVQKALHKDSAHTFVADVKGKPAIISVTPFKDDKQQNPTGIFIAISYLSGNTLSELSAVLNSKELKQIQITENEENANQIVNKNFRFIQYKMPLMKSNFYLSMVFELPEIENILVVQRNYIISIILIAAVVTSLIILLFISKISKSIKNNITIIENISKGKYHLVLEEKEERLLPELFMLSKAVNTMTQSMILQNNIIDKNYEEMIEIINNAVEINDQYTYNHSVNVGKYAIVIAKAINYKDLKEIETAAIFHDIGKISIPSHILNKPGKLTEEEYETVKKHPEEGYKIIRNIQYFSNMTLGVRYHHERYDGKGYPEGLKGEDIPLIAQIISIADVFDALTSDRAYRKALSFETAMNIILEGSGSMFNPVLVNVFYKQMLQQIKPQKTS